MLYLLFFKKSGIIVVSCGFIRMKKPHNVYCLTNVMIKLICYTLKYLLWVQKKVLF